MFQTTVYMPGHSSYRLLTPFYSFFFLKLSFNCTLLSSSSLNFNFIFPRNLLPLSALGIRKTRGNTQKGSDTHGDYLMVTNFYAIHVGDDDDDEHL